MRFRDRHEAGQRLGAQLAERHWRDPVVLGLPRGGVPVAAEVANALGAPLGVLVARKLGAPGQPELGVGAIAEGLAEPVASPAAQTMGIDRDRLRQLAEIEASELARRAHRYRQGPLPAVEGREVVLVDDGLATGVTAEAALAALATQRPHGLILAAGVGARSTADRLAVRADDVVLVLAPRDLASVGAWYENFTQTTDDEVLALLRAGPPFGLPPTQASAPSHDPHPEPHHDH